MSVSLYAKFLIEKTNDKIIELPQGYATYRFLDQNKCYLIDIYVLPEFRKTHIATELSQMVCAEAKRNDCKTLVGTVSLDMKDSVSSIKVLLAHGMRPVSASNNIIIFEKEIAADVPTVKKGAVSISEL